jgi:hypothetical protein
MGHACAPCAADVQLVGDARRPTNQPQIKTTHDRSPGGHHPGRPARRRAGRAAAGRRAAGALCDCDLQPHEPQRRKNVQVRCRLESGLLSVALPTRTTTEIHLTLVFSISRRSNRRFKFPDHPQLKFSPAVGHIPSGGSKRVTATFLSAAPVRLAGQDLKIQTVQIHHKGPTVEWDDVIAAAAAAAAPPPPPHHAPSAGSHLAGRAGGGGRGGGKGGSTAAAMAPGGEPLHDVVPKSQRDVMLKVCWGQA